ncbi:hypothetical protein ACHAW6_003012 [Cyclotella cf. meneghiniana]
MQSGNVPEALSLTSTTTTQMSTCMATPPQIKCWSMPSRRKSASTNKTASIYLKTSPNWYIKQTAWHPRMPRTLSNALPASLPPNWTEPIPKLPTLFESK